jgi:hypothetical protein
MQTNKSSASEPKISSEDVIPSDSTKSNIADNGETPLVSDRSELFKPENVRVDQSYLAGTAKKLLTVLPVKKPNPQAYIRINDQAEYRENVALLELKDERETYLVAPSVLPELDPGEFYLATLYLCVTRSGTPFLWPIRLPGPDGRLNEWHGSAQDVVPLGMKQWIRVKPNREARGYDVLVATGNFPEPSWPEMNLHGLLQVAFKRFYIGALDHPVLKSLRGEA